MMKIRLLTTVCLLCPSLCGAAQPAVSPKEQAGWHKNYSTEFQGANVTAALQLLHERGLKPSGEVIVGIVDSGVDTAMVSLQQAFWVNPLEKADGRDNDGNGYVDDVHGWNFLGTRDGSFNMTSAGTEEYRQFKRLFPKYKNVTSRDSVAEKDQKEYDYYIRMRKAAKIDQYLRYYEIANRSRENLDSLSLRRLAEMEKNIHGIEHDPDKRLLMGDDMTDADDRYYGNPTLTIDGCEHGTFVAGIIGGRAADDPRYSGIAEGVARLMIVRASPDGDEYDKDVATSIRYAVDNGARVINISLGKYESPQARMVNDAIRYALSHDVVIVHAAGNNSKNVDSVAVYPSGTDNLGRFFDNFIRVGSTDEQGRVADFSNYGEEKVHLYAPGTVIAGIMPGNRYTLSQGTSLSAPIVTAIVALLRSYFPYLTAPQIRQLLVETARPSRTVDMLAAVRRILDSPVNWYRAESVSEKYASSRVHAQIPYMSWINGTPFVSYEHAGKKWLVDARSGKTEPYSQAKVDSYKRTATPAKSLAGLSFGGRESAHTADSAYTMLGDRYNLHVRDNKTGEVRQLTTNGCELATYCNRGAKDELSERQAQGYWKGHSYFCMVYDDTAVENLNILHNMEQPPRLETKRMPRPNTNAIRRYHLYWYNADSGEGRQLQLAPNDDYKITLDYDRQSEQLYFLRQSRSVDTLELCRIDPMTGAVSVIISEVCQPHVNVNMFKYHLLDHGRQVLWWSDRTGRGNYYLYDGQTGRLLNRVTQGERLVAGRIEQIDTLGRSIIFQGYGQEEGDPHYVYYYKVGFNGRGQQLLTYGNGTHDLQFSSDGRYALDQYSRMDMPPVWNIVDLRNPKKHTEIFRVPEADCLRAGWVKPTLVRVKAADEQTDLYGVMYTPSWLIFEERGARNEERDYLRQQNISHSLSLEDYSPSSFLVPPSSTKLPVITNVYPGPQDDQIPRRFTVDENGNQSLAELGFVVINVQTRGSSPLRDKDFYCYGYGNLRDYPLADTRHTIEALAAEYPFIDLDRVGIYGHSGGGFQTVAAMLQDPDFYKVGVAASGNHDNREYIQWWAETYHGYGKPVPTNMELADRLKGRLLLMTGEVDENVPVASTIRMADALQKAGKRFDLMVFPEQGHGLIGDYYNNIIRYYFLDHLVKPEKFDIDIVKHQ